MGITRQIKEIVKNVLSFIHLDLTKNIKYDRLTKQIIDKIVKENSVCIDIGAHKGEILDLIFKNSPRQKHYAFEPIPTFYNELKNRYGQKCHVYSFALSDSNGKSIFNHVKNAPAYSGIKQREYAVKDPEIEQIEVQLKKMDEVIESTEKIDFIKIDVEGAEFLVLKGGIETIKRNKPVIVFECGLGASEFYGTKPEELFDFVSTKLGLKLATLDAFVKNNQNLDKNTFCSHYKNGTEYYFAAYPKN